MSDPIDMSTPAAPEKEIPSYLIAANNHNIASGDDKDWVDYMKEVVGGIGGAGAGAALGAGYGSFAGPVGTVIGGVVGGVAGAFIGAKTAESDGKFVAAALVSGGASFYNTAIEINNWMGGDAEKVDAQNKMAEYDSDLAKYYSDNRASADLGGFIIGSFLPMGAGTKVFNYGAKALEAARLGKLGDNMSRATGLLIPSQERFVTQAITEISGQSSVFNLNNANMLKAFATGTAEEAMLGMVQSTAVLASMHASPIFEDMDAKDMAWNILSGGLFQGVLGGLIKGAGAFGAVKRGVNAAWNEASPYAAVAELREGASPIHSVLGWLDEKLAIPDVADDAANAAFKVRTRNSTLAMLNDRVMGKAVEMSGKDTLLGNNLGAVFNMQTDIDEATSRFLGLQSAARATNLSDTEKSLMAARKRLDGGKGTMDDINLIAYTNIKFLKFHGEDAGGLLTDAPIVLSLADRLKLGEEMKVATGYVKAGSKTYQFNTSPKKPWSVIDREPEEIEARNIWAMHPEGAKITTDTVVGTADFPLIDKAIRENVLIKIRTSDGSIRQFPSMEQMTTFREQAKAVAKLELQRGALTGGIVSDPQAVVQKLKQMLGVHFDLFNDPLRPELRGQTREGTSQAMERIQLNEAAIRSGRLTLKDLVGVIKHEEGHNQWNLLTDITPGIEQRSIDDAKWPGLRDEMTRMSQKQSPDRWKGVAASPAHPPGSFQEYLNRPQELAADSFAWLALHPEDAGRYPVFSQFRSAVKPIHPDVLKELNRQTMQLSNEEIAHRLNVRVGYLEGTSVNMDRPLHDLDAMYGGAKEYTEKMVEAGRWNSPEELIKTYMTPQYGKLLINTQPVADMDGNLFSGMAAVKQQQRLFQGTADRAVANVAGSELYAQMPTFSERQSSTASRMGPGQGLIKTADSPYGSFGAMIQQLGNTTHKLIKAFTDETTSSLNSALYGLKTDQVAALEWSALSAKLRSTPEQYYYEEANKSFVLRRVKTNEEAVARGQKPQLADVLDPKAEEFIPVLNDKTHVMILAHMERNGSRVSDKNMLAAANGQKSTLDPRAFYPPPVDPKKYPFFAFVIDPTVTETGHTHMIYAASEKDLDNLIGDVQKNNPQFEVTKKNTELKVMTKAEVERYHKAMGDYSRDDTISENYVRNEVLRTGKSSNFIPPTDPDKIANELLDFHLQKDRELARYTLTTKYSKEFKELQTLGESATNLATSKIGGSSLTRWAENQVSNPFADYVKTALDITNLNEIPRWTAVNNYLDQSFTRVWNTVSSMWQGSKGIADVDKINEEFARVGLRTAFFDSATAAHANHVASDGALTKFVARANGVMATLLLRMDPLNAFNNTAGSTVLTGSELKSVIEAIKRGDAGAVGELAKLANITVPGTGDSILSPIKLYASSVSRFFTNKEAREFVVNNGFAERHIMEVENLISEAAMTGKETDIQLSTKADQLYSRFMGMGDFAEKLTGNKLAEEFNRFVSADIMKQVTDIAVSHNLMSKENAFSYINTFVNRTQGNYLASQRPLMFQGPVGNAIGLFQTYQFNLAQQLLRHVAEGSAKDAALALGLQTAVYGMNGLPGFQQINAHIIGNASGNTNHRDLYDATYEGAGKDAGDWLMYGTASNMLGFLSPELKMNLYTRGDINPRQPTIVPTSPSEVPIISGFARFFTSLKASISAVANGGNGWQAMLQGIEHSGINRPLAGLAQTLEAMGNPSYQSYSTSTKGNVIAANDLWSLTNLTRIAGGKPLDEAIAVDAGYRLDAYKTKDVQARTNLGDAIKTTVIAGQQPSQEQVEKFAAEYAKIGGKQEGFNQFFIGVMKRANTSQVNAISDSLRSPYSESMQRILGGYELKDFEH